MAGPSRRTRRSILPFWPGLLPRSMEAALALVEAEGEFIEIGLQMFAAQAVIDAKTPGFQV